MSERSPMDRIAAGDAAAFDEIFRAHYSELVHIAERYVHDRQTAEEVAQEVFVELWRRRATLVLRTTLRAYLISAARNRSLNRLRHERTRARAAPFLRNETPDPIATSDLLVEREIDEAVRQAVASLPDRCREVFELSRVGGLRYAEIADVMDISIKTVEAQMGKALRVLRERLSAWLPEGEP